MSRFQLPSVDRAPATPPRTAVMIASGDSRLSANQLCWPTQRETERQVAEAFAAVGWDVVRGSPEHWSDAEPHGFVFRQCQGREVFAGISVDAPLVVVESVWQYSMHVLPGLLRHRGPILLIANWSGQWPGLVGALNLRGSLTKAGREHSLLWAEDFSDPTFRSKLAQWCESGRVEHDLSHVAEFEAAIAGADERELARALAAQFRHRPAILGVFDEGCMGMFNAIVPDHLLHAIGMFKERLSQATLYAHMQRVGDAEAGAVIEWLRERGMRFDIGTADDQLREEQLLEQGRMYVAALRLADHYGCDAIGIQYQLGLTELCVASDLVEGMLNCSERPDVQGVEGPNAGEVLYAGRPLPHFNEVDECSGVDALLTDRIWRAMGMCPDNTLHDVRWSDRDHSGTREEEIFVLEISGAVPASHFEKGWASATGYRQPAMYFAQGGSGVRAMSRPGPVVWSRVWIDGAARAGAGELMMDLGLLSAVALPDEEMERRWNSTTKQWPIMNAVFHGVSRDQLMAAHQSNHIQVVYADDEARARSALRVKALLAQELGMRVRLCGCAEVAGD